MWQWIANNYIEVIGATLALLFLLLEVRQKWTMWVVGVFSSAFYILIFYQAKVYAQMGLNAYFLLMNAYGFYYWRIAPQKKNKELNTSHIQPRIALYLVGATVVLTLLITWILKSFTDSEVPFSDALLAALSIVATWLVAHKVLENWFVWIFVNTYSVALYYYLEMFPTAVLYAMYASMSVVGYLQWQKTIYKENTR